MDDKIRQEDSACNQDSWEGLCSCCICPFMLYFTSIIRVPHLNSQCSNVLSLGSLIRPPRTRILHNVKTTTNLQY